MKITHRNPTANWFYVPPSAAVDAEYAAEVQRATEHGEREYQRRQDRLTRAEARLAKAKRQHGKKTAVKRQLAQLTALVELRRAELEEYRRSMVAAPASAEHRGVRSFRPVPPVTGVPL